MVDLTRRKTVIGLGLLATGSGATFTSASFQDNINPSSDIRVVAADELILEPGILFRDSANNGGGNVDDPVDPVNGNFTSGTNDTVTRNNSSNPLFTEDGDSSSDLGDGLGGVGDLPAASVNDATNGSINLQVALPLGEDGKVGNSSNGLLQVRNESNKSREIAIRYSEFGSDAGTVTNNLICDIVSFKNSKNQNKISPVNNDSSPQEVDNLVTLDQGEDLQIYLDYDTTSNNGAKSALEDAAAGGNKPFSNPSTDTVNLLNEIKVGAEDPNDQDVN